MWKVLSLPTTAVAAALALCSPAMTHASPDDTGGHCTWQPVAPSIITVSDTQMVTMQKAGFREEPDLLSDRREGKCVVSYKTTGGWVAISKNVLTAVLAKGRDVKMVGLPPAAIAALTLLCRTLVIVPEQRKPG